MLPPRNLRARAAVKIVAIVAAVLVSGFALIMVIGSDNRPAPIRIAEECEKSYGSQGSSAVMACRLTLSAKLLADSEQKKLDDTYRRAR